MSRDFIESLVEEHKKVEVSVNNNKFYYIERVLENGDIVDQLMFEASRQLRSEKVLVPVDVTHLINPDTRDELAMFYKDEYDAALDAEKMENYIPKGFPKILVNQLIAVGLGLKFVYETKSLDYKRKLFDNRFGSLAMASIVKLHKQGLVEYSASTAKVVSEEVDATQASAPAKAAKPKGATASKSTTKNTVKK